MGGNYENTSNNVSRILGEMKISNHLELTRIEVDRLRLENLTVSEREGIRTRIFTGIKSLLRRFPY